MKAPVGESPLFVADWLNAVFIHYRVETAALRPCVPLELDLHEEAAASRSSALQGRGKAMVSLVAFTLRGMRLNRGGKLGAWICRPIATHQFFNVRTYVRQGDDSGIFFLAEWLNNPLSVRLGPWPYGLPYRLGRLRYEHERLAGRSPSRVEGGCMSGEVRDARSGDAFRYRAELADEARFERCREGSLDAFLLERYLAFTCRGGTRRRFRVWHAPWEMAAARVAVLDDALLRHTFPWFAAAELLGAHVSPGVRDVGMGLPRRVTKGRVAHAPLHPALQVGHRCGSVRA